MPFWTQIEVVNPTDETHVFTIPKGRMIAPKELRDKVQNLVVTDDTTVKIPPNGKAIVTVPTECTDPTYAPPNNTRMDVTVFGQQVRKDSVFPGRTM